MKRIKIIIYSLYVSSLFIILSCQEEIEIELPIVQQHVVVNSLFAPWSYISPNPLTVFVERSTSFFDSLRILPVTNASVTIYKDDSLVKDLVYIDSLNFYSINIESTTDIPNLTAGANYKLIVRLNDTIIEAEDRVPFKTDLQDIQIIPNAGINENEFIFSKVNLSIDDDIDEPNYYEIQLLIIGNSEISYISSDDPVITTEPSYPSNINIGSEPSKRLLFRDITFNGQHKDISIYYTPPNSTMKDSVLNHTIEIRLLSISETYYNYRSSQIIQHNNKEVNILYGQAEPINVYSNIIGGYGVFAAYNIDSRVYTIDSNEIINE